jgi:hypothetical protein
MVPKEQWADLVAAQNHILQLLKKLNEGTAKGVPVSHITAAEFMRAVRIKRTKFDQLVQSSQIKITKKKRKIYVPISEVNRYFSDTNIP